MNLRLDRAWHRVQRFVRFTWRRFVDERCLQTAGALAFTSLFALVPLTAAILGILAAFPAFAEWRARLTGFVFRNFVPAAGDVVSNYLTEFADNASKATAVGILVLLFSAVSLMLSIEDAYNRIWRVPTTRAAVTRFVIYWTALTAGPLLVVAALAISSYLAALPFVDAAAAQFSLKARLLGLLPFLIVLAALGSSYVVIPNRGVRLRDAMLGAALAALLFEAAKRGFALYVTTYANYEQVYGTLAIVPIFIFWIYLSWIIVLLGASITASLSAFDDRPADRRLPRGREFDGLLRVVARFGDAHRAGQALSSAALRAREPWLTDELLQRYLADLDRLGLIRRTEFGEWVLARDLAAVSALELCEQGGYRLPLGTVPDVIAKAPGGALVESAARAARTVLDVPLAGILVGAQAAPSTEQESAT